MAQLILGSPVEILSETDEATDLENFGGTDWVGIFQITLMVAGTDPVKLEKRRHGTDTWVPVHYKNEAIELSTLGDTRRIELTKSGEYRLSTDTVGAAVQIENY